MKISIGQRFKDFIFYLGWYRWLFDSSDFRMKYFSSSNVKYHMEKLAQGSELFVHIPKCAGSSMEKFLYESGRTLVENIGHFTASEIFYGRSARRFLAVTRDPASRFISAFYYLKSGGGNPVDRRFGENFLMKFDTPESLINAAFDSPLIRANMFSWIHFVPQYKFIEGYEDFAIVVPLDELDEFMRINFNSDLDKVNISRVTNKSTMNSETLRSLKELYADDFDLYEQAKSNTRL